MVKVKRNDFLESYLNANNMYIYSYDVFEVNNSRSVGSTDVQMSSVLIVYDNGNDTWSVTGGGHWSSSSYEDDAPNPDGWIGAQNVGGLDAVGFALMNTSGTIPTLLSATGYAHDGEGGELYLSNPYNSDSSYGTIFQFQDQVYFSDDFQRTLYLGYGFAAQGIYSSNFSEYNGRARSYYAHTWEDCVINSIGISKTGFSASWSNFLYGWEIYNNSDTAF